jgi:hypothetical protein
MTLADIAHRTRPATWPPTARLHMVPAVNCPSRIDHRLVIVLFATDAAFVLLHLALGRGVFHNELLSMYHDGGFAEWFQYTKEFWIFVLLAILAVRKRSGLLFTLSLLFAYLLVDDSRQLHEKLGRVITEWAALQNHNLGELLWSAAVGAIFLVPIGLGYLRSDGDTRRIARWILGLTALLAFFAGVVDTLNMWVRIGGLSMVDLGGEVIEEIGELVVMSAILTFVFGLVPDRLALSSGRPDTSRPEEGVGRQEEPRLAASQFHSN